MNENIKLSIIIPIYGVEKCINQFLDSLMPQLTDEIECIFIDDGCKDLSIEILKEYLIRYNTINYQIIIQKNQGLSVARNNGMKLVTGDYFTFIDPDDKVSHNYCNEILKSFEKGFFDIIHFNAIKIHHNGKHEKLTLANKYEIIEVNEKYLLSHFEKKHWYVWLRVFNKKYLKVLHFPENKTFEDILSVPFCYESSQKIYHIPKYLIHYLYRASSISNGRKKRCSNVDSFIYGIYLYKDYKDIVYYKIIYSQLILMSLTTLLDVSLKKYINFCIEFKNDLKDVYDFNHKLSKNDKFALKRPFMFYLYKWQSRFFRLKFLRK